MEAQASEPQTGPDVAPPSPGHDLDDLIRFRAPHWLYQAISREAGREGLTISAFLRRMLTRWAHKLEG